MPPRAPPSGFPLLSAARSGRISLCSIICDHRIGNHLAEGWRFMRHTYSGIGDLVPSVAVSLLADSLSNSEPTFTIHTVRTNSTPLCLVSIAKRSHPFPFRTRPLSSSAPTIVFTAKIGRCQTFLPSRSSFDGRLFYASTHRHRRAACARAVQGTKAIYQGQPAYTQIGSEQRNRRVGGPPSPFGSDRGLVRSLPGIGTRAASESRRATR